MENNPNTCLILDKDHILELPNSECKLILRYTKKYHDSYNKNKLIIKDRDQERLKAKPKLYHTAKIRTLLCKGFSEIKLTIFIYDNPKFKPLYYQINTRELGRAEIIHSLIEYSEQQELLDDLLEWAKTENNDKYLLYQPYWD